MPRPQARLLAHPTRQSRTPFRATRCLYNPHMPHVIEPATSARAKCRGCDQKIDKGELRFGERQPNAFGEGEMTLWFHVPCAAFKRPEPFLELARASAEPAVT